MTVSELIYCLQNLDPDIEVVITHPYGDRSDNIIAEEPYHFTRGFIAHSNYHDGDKVVEEGVDKARPVLLIGGP